MGVTGLWQILHPCARPIKLETLNRKRLAVDASIWIYQFLKAVRDKEGNALRNSHIVGFFRRICKLLFFGIRPVFVFDGGAPVLKRQTVTERKKRREGRREDAVRTAGRLLAVQMQRRAEEEEAKRKEERDTGEDEEVAVPDEGLVYVDEVHMTQQERQQNRKFRKKDAYHLPNLDVSMSEMGGPNDPRVMSLEDLQAYARQFETGEDINVYDFSKIDYDSPFFVSLPASDRYNILNAARLRSRLRMGHSKEQLDTMFPDRMAFSKFQIDRVRERNELTQRLMHLNEGGDTLFNGGRVAGEKGREYVLVKNDGVEGGWALGVISDEGKKQETAIDLDKPVSTQKPGNDDWEDEGDFEDVPIEGLNRLPKRPKLDADAGDAFTRQRQAFHKSRKPGQTRRSKPAVHPNPLFVAEESAEEDGGEEWEEVDGNAQLFGEDDGAVEEEDEDLRRALAMSLEKEQPTSSQPDQPGAATVSDAENEDHMQEVFQQQASVPDARPLPVGSGRAIASMVNKRAFDAAPESREVTSFGVPASKSDHEESGNDSEDDVIDLQAALAQSRRMKRKVSPLPQRKQLKPVDAPADVAKAAGFSGPLPFEKLDLGSSLLGKTKMQERSEEAAGGFENPKLAEKQHQGAEPLPPWFGDADLGDGMRRQKALEREDRERAREFGRQFQFQSRHEGKLRRQQTGEVIDLEAEDQEGTDGLRDGEVIDLEAEDDEKDEGKDGIVLFDQKLRMGDAAEKVRVEPPVSEEAGHRKATPWRKSGFGPFGVDDSGQEEILQRNLPSAASEASVPSLQGIEYRQDEEMLEWSESEDGREKPAKTQAASVEPASGPIQQGHTPRSPSAEFEDVDIPDKPAAPGKQPAVDEMDMDGPAPASGLVHQDFVPDDVEQTEFDDFSDLEEEELLRALTLEAEEHARFASTLNNKSHAQNVADYEKELKQLRNQQKKDRRDADEVTHIMIQECQQLLRLFGLPYVTAPMEAEAQCAELVSLGLVDGIVTDDSDCFLFGGTRIYKNMFNQAKFVECYLTSDLEKEFDLTRQKLIQVAHLLGSDYTEGLPGVGPVTALEILSEFQNLVEFKDWWSGVQMNTISKSEDAGNSFKKKFRRNATKLFLPPIFPDTRVDTAYTNPEVDSDPEPFQWGVPDLDALRSFLMATIGWGQERTDEVLVPVIKDMNRRMDEGTQSNITAFFDGGVGIGAAGATKASARGEVFAPRRKVAESSKRMGSALSRMAEKAKMSRDGTIGNTEAETDGEVASSGKRSTAKKSKVTKRPKDDTDAPADEGNGSDFEAPKRKSRTRPAAAKGK